MSEEIKKNKVLTSEDKDTNKKNNAKKTRSALQNQITKEQTQEAKKNKSDLKSVAVDTIASESSVKARKQKSKDLKTSTIKEELEMKNKKTDGDLKTKKIEKAMNDKNRLIARADGKSDKSKKISEQDTSKSGVWSEIERRIKSRSILNLDKKDSKTDENTEGSKIISISDFDIKLLSDRMLQKLEKLKNESNVYSEQEESENKASNIILPVLALREIVCFPNSVATLFVGREKSISAVEKAMETDGLIALVTEKSAHIDDVKDFNLYNVGTIGTILQKIQLPNGTIKILVDIECRAEIKFFMSTKKYIEADCEMKREREIEDTELIAIIRHIKETFSSYCVLRKISNETLESIINIDRSFIFMDAVSSALQLSYAKKQEILEIMDIKARAYRIIKIINEEIEIANIDQEIKDKIKEQIDKNQKEYYLNEQMKAIRKELGDGENNVQKYEEMLAQKHMPEYTKNKIKEEIKRLQNAAPISSETIRSYLDWIFALPWGKITREKVSLDSSFKVISESHYGLKKVKGIILEYIATQIIREKPKGTVLCLYGPPGVGKTSLVKSIAKAMGRKYAKISLGGIRDEAEIKGHRRTYIAAMPGKIIQAIKKTGVDNPVILLDEIDKMAHDHRGDPESALLEVLDSDQSASFQDHYIEVDYDLSNVIFIATSNTLNMQRPLLDRLQIVNIPSYLSMEKINICKNYIIPKAMKEHNLTEEHIEITDDAIKEVIDKYTKESGVRNLGRTIETICKKVVVRLLLDGVDLLEKSQHSNEKSNHEKQIEHEQEIETKEGERDKNKMESEHSINNNYTQEKDQNQIEDLSVVEDILKLKVSGTKITIDKNYINLLLGAEKYSEDKLETGECIGTTNGLAYTDFGGEILPIEAVIIPHGKGDVIFTGKLGDVMKESMRVASSYVKSKVDDWNIPESFFKKFNIHLHAPAGAIPKDGPSAGVTICVTLASVLLNIPVRQDVSMTGEVNLRGKVLPIGGLREKLLAAIKYKMKKAIIPKENLKDLLEIPDEIKNKIEIIPCENVEEVLRNALVNFNTDKAKKIKNNKVLKNENIVLNKTKQDIMIETSF